MRGQAFASAIAVTCVTSLATITLAQPAPQDVAGPGESPSGAASRSTTPRLPVTQRIDAGYLGSCPCPGGTLENEANCGLNPDGSADQFSDTVNGGCNSLPNVFSPIALGETYCGTTAWNVGVGGWRDTDWYEIVLTEATIVTWVVTAEFPVQTLIIDGTPGCASFDVVASAAFAACTEGQLTATLPPGTYWFFVGPNGGPPVPCGTHYTASLRGNLGARYCSPNLPNSTGDAGLMIVTGSAVDADDDLTLTALQLPTNSNIGYFLMGTGTNTFIPVGAGSFLCVAPGLKRYLPPVNNTNQFPGGFDRVVGTQGNGHPVSVSITPGSTWNFQAWHRDSDAGTSHFTDAVSVTFQ